MKRLTTIGIVFILLFIGVSSYAISDSGVELNNWYERARAIVMGNVDQEKSNELNKLALSISQEERDQLAEADKEVAFLSTLISENSNKEISNYHLRYISIVNETEKELAKKNFNTLENEEVNKMENELESDIVSILADILK